MSLSDAIEEAFWKNLGEQADYGPSVDFDWLLGAVLDALPPTGVDND